MASSRSGRKPARRGLEVQAPGGAGAAQGVGEEAGGGGPDQQLEKSARRGPTMAEKSFAVAKQARTKARINEAIELNHRQRMEKLNLHLGSLSEHFDIPKVGPG
ncbi:unnamed protein product [Prorocentrum cordatum]|uniref:Protein FAM32A n=1 Tax=Prorocentrum cordatum TaxID=2364126 RepID=A0ABN9TV59_9DINO|nr:unnamed protein product [Polarella glacialis]